MELTSWGQIILICFLGAITPGPSLAVVVTNTINRGKICGSVTGISHAFGIVIWAMLTVVGLSTIILNYEVVLNIFQIIGACLILYIGYRTSITASKSVPSPKTLETLAPNRKLTRAALEGFGISIMNPKIALFFLAIFSQFVNTDSNWVEIFIMGLTAGIIDGAWYTTVALVIGDNKMVSTISKRRSLILRASGILLALISIYLLIDAAIKLFVRSII